MADKAFINIKPIGDLFICDVLLKYIFPRIFICKDNKNQKYLFYDISEDSSIDKWLISPIKDKHCKKLIEGKSPVQKYIKKRKTILVQKDYKNMNKVESKKPTKQEFKCLPHEAYYMIDNELISTE